MYSQVAVLVFKALEVYAILLGIGPGTAVFPNFFLNYPDLGSDGYTWLLWFSVLSPSVLPLLAGVTLWAMAKRLAKHFAGDRASSQQSNFRSMEQVYVLTFVSIGVLLLCSLAPKLAKLTYYYWQASTVLGVEVGNIVERRMAIVEFATQLVVGLVLVLRPRKIAKLVGAQRDGP